MSTSEFENEWDDQCVDPPFLLAQEAGLPEDFTAEDLAFAQQMNAFFAPELEEIPPYFVQTLLTAEDPLYRPADRGLEYKTQVQVFRRLKLRRHLFKTWTPSISTFTQHILKPHRSVLALMVACTLFAVFTMVAAGPSFASGLNILLSGHHSGVMQVNSYPVLSPQINRYRDAHTMPPLAKISLQETQQELNFPIHSPTNIPAFYSLNAVYIYQGVDQSWADGPALSFEYTYERQGQTARGSGKISVSEFKPQGQVLQVVQQGAAHSIELGKNGNTQAIYVDGQWVRINKFSHAWVYGSRSEIIYEHDGIIFWIVGDQRDGIDQTTLLNIAKSLQIFDTHTNHLMDHFESVSVSPDNTSWPFINDIVYSDNSSGSSMETISPGSSTLKINVTPAPAH